jgi:hypothetical protein
VCYREDTAGSWIVFLGIDRVEGNLHIAAVVSDKPFNLLRRVADKASANSNVLSCRRTAAQQANQGEKERTESDTHVSSSELWFPHREA